MGRPGETGRHPGRGRERQTSVRASDWVRVALAALRQPAKAFGVWWECRKVGRRHRIAQTHGGVPGSRLLCQAYRIASPICQTKGPGRRCGSVPRTTCVGPGTPHPGGLPKGLLRALSSEVRTSDRQTDKSMPHQRLHAIVHGRVQGVNFRWYTRERAARLGLTGWVRNLWDGRRVEVVAEGETAGLQDLVRFLHRGPPSAHVQDLEVSWQGASGDLSGFIIRFL